LQIMVPWKHDTLVSGTMRAQRRAQSRWLKVTPHYAVVGDRGDYWGGDVNRGCRSHGLIIQRKSPSEDGLSKKPPPLPCRTRSFEHVSLHVELVCLLSASSEGMPATVRTHSVIVLITVQGLLRITNRAGKSIYPKNNLCLIHRPFAGGSQGIFLKIFSVRRC